MIVIRNNLLNMQCRRGATYTTFGARWLPCILERKAKSPAKLDACMRLTQILAELLFINRYLLNFVPHLMPNKEALYRSFILSSRPGKGKKTKLNRQLLKHRFVLVFRFIKEQNESLKLCI